MNLDMSVIKPISPPKLAEAVSRDRSLANTEKSEPFASSFQHLLHLFCMQQQ